MTEPDSAITGLVDIGNQALVENASRLGLTWRLQLGTVTESSSENSLQVRVDGDDISILVISMIGAVAAGKRVYIITVPPAGNYAVGEVSRIAPGQRVATTTRVANVGTFTAETELDSVTASLTEGRTYRVVWYGRLFSSVADGIARFRIREDSITGTVLAITQLSTATTLNQSFPVYIEVQYTATVTEDKTFVTTAVRQAGTGNLTAQAGTDAVTYMYVDFVE